MNKLLSPAEVQAVAGVPLKAVYKAIEQRLPRGSVVRRNRQPLPLHSSRDLAAFRVLTKAGPLFEETPGDEQTLQAATRRLRRATGFSGQFLGGELIAIGAGSGS